MNPQPPAAPSQILPSTIGEEYYVGAAIGINPDTGRAVPISYPCASNIRFVGWCEKRITGDGVRTVSCRVDQSYKPQAQPPAAPITPEEIAALRDALAKATPGEWATGKGGRPMYAGDTQIVDVNDDGDVFILASFNHNFDVSKGNAAFSTLAHNLAPKLLAALDAAEAQAVEFAWDALAFAGVCVNSESGIYNDCANSSAESAAEYLAARGLLEHVGGRIWRRVSVVKPEEGK